MTGSVRSLRSLFRRPAAGISWGRALLCRMLGHSRIERDMLGPSRGTLRCRQCLDEVWR